MYKELLKQICICLKTYEKKVKLGISKKIFL